MYFLYEVTTPGAHKTDICFTFATGIGIWLCPVSSQILGGNYLLVLSDSEFNKLSIRLLFKRQMIIGVMVHSESESSGMNDLFTCTIQVQF